jgi:hypothetical protein
MSRRSSILLVLGFLPLGSLHAQTPGSPNPLGPPLSSSAPVLVGPPPGSGSNFVTLTGFDDRSQWLAALPCVPNRIGFESLAPGTVVTTQLAPSGVTLVSGGSVFENPTIQEVGASSNLPFPMFPPGTLPSEPNFLSNRIGAPVYACGSIRFEFAAPTAGTGAFVADGSPIASFRIEVFNGATSLGSIMVPPRTLPNSFAGVISSTPFTAAEFVALSPYDSWGLDDLELCLATAASYCTAKTNSLGCLPAIAWTGSPSATASSGFVVKSSPALNHKSGLLFYGVSGQAAIPFLGGTLCVKSPVKRTPGTVSTGNPPPAVDCSGTYSIDMNAFAQGALGGQPLPALKSPGTVVDCEWYGRDPGFAAPNNVSLSNGLEYVIGP